MKCQKNKYLSTVEYKKKLSKQEEQRQNHGYGEILTVSRWEGCRGECVKRGLSSNW